MTRFWTSPRVDISANGHKIISRAPIRQGVNCDYSFTLRYETREGIVEILATTIVRKRKRDFGSAVEGMIREGWSLNPGTSKHRFRHHEVTLTLLSSTR